MVFKVDSKCKLSTWCGLKMEGCILESILLSPDGPNKMNRFLWSIVIFGTSKHPLLQSTTCREDIPKTFTCGIGELLSSRTYDCVGNRSMMFVSTWLRTTWICHKICFLHLDSLKRCLEKSSRHILPKLVVGWFHGDLIHGKIIR